MQLHPNIQFHVADTLEMRKNVAGICSIAVWDSETLLQDYLQSHLQFQNR